MTTSSAALVFSKIINAMSIDNGFAFVATPEEVARAIPPIEKLIQKGYFQDDPDALDGSFWMAAAGEADDVIEFFELEPEAYAALDLVLNQVFTHG